MPIDFHHASNARTYASRDAHPDWFAHTKSLLSMGTPGIVADIGCGGGIYSRAWKELGAESVIGLDFSAQMIEDARAATNEESIHFSVGIAYETGLDDSTCDIVFSRAVLHYLEDHPAASAEAMRILKPGGMFIVQDRSIEDVFQPVSQHHFRAHYSSEFPRPIEVERRR